MENEKKKRKSNKSALILEMIQYYFENTNQKDIIKRYIRGYKKIPEESGKIAELEKEEYQILEKDFQ